MIKRSTIETAVQTIRKKNKYYELTIRPMNQN